MTRSELQDHGADEPVWRFIAQLERERFTGQADVGVDTRVELYVAEGRVYFAQKADDPPLGARLVSTGVITGEQFRNGSVKVGDNVSLARLFQRVPAVDRDAVELMTERLGRQVLETVSERPVGSVVLHPLRHHPSGIHQWFPDAPPAPEDDEPSPAMAALVHDVVAAVSGAVPVVSAEPEPTPVPMPAPAPAPAMTFEVLVTDPTAETALPTLSSLQGLTPLPTLGEVGTRMPTPTTVAAHQPGAMDTQGLPILGTVGTSFQPLVAGAPAEPADEAADDPAADPAVEPSSALAATPLPPPPPTEQAVPLPPPTIEAATEEIWDMVDDMLGLPHNDATLVNAGGPAEDRKGRGWLRGRRG